MRSTKRMTGGEPVTGGGLSARRMGMVSWWGAGLSVARVESVMWWEGVRGGDTRPMSQNHIAAVAYTVWRSQSRRP